MLNRPIESIPSSSPLRLRMYYDGLCHLCSREIKQYKSSRGSDQIEFVDITRPEFDAKKEGLDPFLVHRFIHVRTAEGQIYTGVEAFLQVWQVLPGYRWLGKLVRNPILFPVSKGLYSLFAKIRPLLPQIKPEDCAESPYCELKRKDS